MLRNDLYTTGAVVTEWIKLHFRNPHRPKCLILIGPTGTGINLFNITLVDRLGIFAHMLLFVC